MKKIILIAVFLSSCSALISAKGLPVQDCVTTHVKAMTRNGTVLSESMYDKIVEACNHIYDGRP